MFVILSFFPEPLIAAISHLIPMKVPTRPTNPTIAAKKITSCAVKVVTFRTVRELKAVRETIEPIISAYTNREIILLPVSFNDFANLPIF